MSARPLLIALLVISHFVAAQGWATGQAEEQRRECPVMSCAPAPCAGMPCCAVVPQAPRTPEPASAPRATVDLAPVSCPTFSILYTLPDAVRHEVVHESARLPHALPRLAASCIRLI